MCARNDFDETIRPDENDVLVTDTDLFDLLHRPSIAIVGGDNKWMKFSSPQQASNLRQDTYLPIIWRKLEM